MSRGLLPARLTRYKMEIFSGKFLNGSSFVIVFVSFFCFFLFYVHSSAFTNTSIDIQSAIPIGYVNTVTGSDSGTPEPVREAGISSVVSAPYPDAAGEVHVAGNPEAKPPGRRVPVVGDPVVRLIDYVISGPDPLQTQVPRFVAPENGGLSPSPEPAGEVPVAGAGNGTTVSDPCSGRYVFVHELPKRFNSDLLKACRSLSLWADMCIFTSNAGLGPPLKNRERFFPKKGWFATDQFTLDLIFHNRMKSYKCLTPDSSKASAIFVPFYAGFDISRHLWDGHNISVRDAAGLDLVSWLIKRPEWKVMGGRDHFLVGGRITWDFRRISNENSHWGNNFFFLPESKNMTMLVLESSPWNANDQAIPYPTYFHPSKAKEVFSWQGKMRGLRRPWLFSFAGAPRPDLEGSIRDQIIDQCRSSKQCLLLQCDSGGNKCHSPTSVMKMFQTSVFCLQPQGDSYTRRSTFDSMLGGCIPVFFHPGSAYIQYTWHLPKDYTRYSVFIPEEEVREGKVSIERRLVEIPDERIREMRKEVIQLIPKLIYADPRGRLDKVEDAFDVAVKGVIEKVDRVRREMKEGKIEMGYSEENRWKYELTGDEGPHEWDHFFDKKMKVDT